MIKLLVFVPLTNFPFFFFFFPDEWATLSAVCFQPSLLLNLDAKEWERRFVSDKRSGSWEGPVGVVPVGFSGGRGHVSLTSKYEKA